MAEVCTFLYLNKVQFDVVLCYEVKSFFFNQQETHIIHQFDSDFYGDIMKIIVLGFIRPMCDFPSLGEVQETSDILYVLFVSVPIVIRSIDVLNSLFMSKC